MHDRRIKFNNVWTCIRASEAQEKLKDFGRRYEERSIKNQHLELDEKNHAEVEDLHQTLKNRRP